MFDSKTYSTSDGPRLTIDACADQLTAEQVTNSRAFVAAYQPWLERLALEHVMGGDGWLIFAGSPFDQHKPTKAPPGVDVARERAFRAGYSKGFLAALDVHLGALVPTKKLQKIKNASAILLGRWRAEKIVYGAPRENPVMGAAVDVKPSREGDAPQRRSYFGESEAAVK